VNYPRVLCLGEILFDLLADQPGKPLEKVESWTGYAGGAPANVACALVKLGTSAGFVGCVGNDEPGESLVKLLTEVGVDCRGVQRHDTAPTRQVYVVRSDDGDRSFAGFGDLPPDAFADTYLMAENLSVELFEHAECLVLGTLELAYPHSRKAIAKALDFADQYDVKVLLDVNRRDMFWSDPEESPALISELLKRIDFLKVTVEEAEWLFNTTDPGAITYRLDNLEGVLVTDGDKGCAYCLSENEGTLPAFAIDVVDTTGAGDGFVAGIVHQICQHGVSSLQNAENVKQMVRFASGVGAITTMKPGAIEAQPTTAEVEAFLSTH
jgi:fructokinase